MTCEIIENNIDTVIITIPEGLNLMSNEGFKTIFKIGKYRYMIKSYHICNNRLILERIP